jgi:hypothetical protein
MARVPVTSPDFTPLPFGLFSVAQFPPNSDVHVQNGVLHQPGACEPAKTTLNPCPVVTGLPKSPSATGIPTMGADPFTVYTWIDCGPIGAQQAEYEARVLDQLDRGAPRAVEATFWTGAVSTTGAPEVLPHLAENTAVLGPGGEISQLAASPVTTGTAVDVVEALGLLEGALALCYGGVGVIHVTRAAIPHLKSQSLIYHDETTGQYKTCNGNLVAAGAGYPGTSPAGAAPTAGETWFYATGAVEIFVSSPDFTTAWAESVDKINNQLVMLAERTYVITWDCCLFAAQVQLGGAVQGGIGVRT